MPQPNNNGLLPNGWPFWPGVDPSSGVQVTPTPSFPSAAQANWTVPSGKFWLPLYFMVSQTCGGGAPPWTTFEIVVASGYFGPGNTIGLSQSALHHVGFSPVAGQVVHLAMGIYLGDQVMAPADVTQLAYASASMIPMLLGPGDNIRMVFFDKGGGTLAGAALNYVAAEFDQGGSSQDDGPLVATPILA